MLENLVSRVLFATLEKIKKTSFHACRWLRLKRTKRRFTSNDVDVLIHLDTANVNVCISEQIRINIVGEHIINNFAMEYIPPSIKYFDINKRKNHTTVPSVFLFT